RTPCRLRAGRSLSGVTRRKTTPQQQALETIMSCFTKLFSRAVESPRRPGKRTRLGVEQLDDRLNPSPGITYSAMEIPGQGVFVHASTGAWQHPTTMDASEIAANDSGQVAMEIQGRGVFVYNAANGAWQHPTTTNASELDIDEAGQVAMEIPNQGVF